MSSNFSSLNKETLSSAMKSHVSLRRDQDDLEQANIFNTPLQLPSGDTIKIRKNVYGLTPEINKTLSSALYRGNILNNKTDFVMFYNNMSDIGYTPIGDKTSKRKSFNTEILLQKLSKIEY